MESGLQGSGKTSGAPLTELWCRAIDKAGNIQPHSCNLVGSLLSEAWLTLPTSCISESHGQKASESMLRPIQSLAGKSEAGALAVWPFPGQSLLYHREAICISDCNICSSDIWLPLLVGAAQGRHPKPAVGLQKGDGDFRVPLPSPRPLLSLPPLLQLFIHSSILPPSAPSSLPSPCV